MNPWTRRDRELKKLERPYVANVPCGFYLSEFFCRHCEELKPRAEYADFDDPERLHVWCKDCRLKFPYPIPDYIIRSALRVPPGNSVPTGLIDLKRAAMQLRRLRKNHENHQRTCGVDRQRG